ncbi:MULTISPECIES: IS110 family transposase [Brevibacterium]|uniref:IS110 family transposase n=1 Tax=Brevibacterium TaxID=1696 RepID=UPI001F17F2CB|nr:MULTISPECIES: IS110 family transposase [Brevibacterium]
MRVFGCGRDTIAQLLITAGDNPDRLRSEAAFAALAGVCPIPASSGKTKRHRLNRVSFPASRGHVNHVTQPA